MGVTRWPSRAGDSAAYQLSVGTTAAYPACAASPCLGVRHVRVLAETATTQDAAWAEWRAVADRLRERFPRVSTLMDEAEHDVLAYMSFHRSHWTQIYSTNVIERLNLEVKRRTNVVQIFPNEAAIIRLVGALLLEQNDEWAVGRRYMSLETMAGLSDDPQVKPAAIPKA